ncbi:MAG: hypothetical protein ABFD54_13650 [Armatimonadota bacterium]|nr:hypothetical protein [bacterium]
MMDVAFSVLAVLGMGYGAYRAFKWMLHAGQIQARNDQPLSSTDLKVLEETAARLMADMRMVTDECVARIQAACAEAEARINILETPQVVALDKAPPAIAEVKGMTNGEVELLRGLQSIDNRK